MRRELDTQSREGELGLEDEERIAELTAEIADTEKRLAETEAEFQKERVLVDEIVAFRGRMAKAAEASGADVDNTAAPAGEMSAAVAAPVDGDPEVVVEEPRAGLKSRLEQLEGIDAARRMIYAHVDEPAVASVVSDWTGIPIGRMVKDEVQTVLQLAEIMGRRVVGQDHGLG